MKNAAHAHELKLTYTKRGHETVGKSASEVCSIICILLSWKKLDK